MLQCYFLYFLPTHLHDISYFIYMRYYILSFTISFLYDYDKFHRLGQ